MFGYGLREKTTKGKASSVPPEDILLQFLLFFPFFFERNFSFSCESSVRAILGIILKHERSFSFSSLENKTRAIKKTGARSIKKKSKFSQAR